MALATRGPLAGARTRPARAAAASRRPAVRVSALFGFGAKKEDEVDWKKEDRDEQFRIQQELLEKRRTGSSIRAADERRRKVSETLASRKAERAQEREALGRGEMPESLAKWKPYKKKEDADGTGGIVIPLNPLGMRMYDEGERFDLRSPYSDDGWVDPDETDAFAGLKNIGRKLWFKSFQETKPDERKPIIWASTWERRQAEAKQQKQQGKQGKK